MINSDQNIVFIVNSNSDMYRVLSIAFSLIFGTLSFKPDVRFMPFHLKNNQLGDCRVPSWICCNLEGNNADFDESAAMDVYEGDTLEAGKCPCK